MLDVYSNINEPDGIYGINSTHSTGLESQISIYEHESNWEKTIGG